MSNSRKKSREEDEVEQLLRAAQEDMLLKLSLNSHMARTSAIDPDLDRRFLALKTKPVKKTLKVVDDAGGSNAAVSSPDDDLFARFAALKSSVPSHRGKEESSNIRRDGSVDQQVTEEEDNDGEDEVEKVIKWAIDAARLDPSPPSDDEDRDDDDDDDNSDDDDDGVGKGKKSKRK